MLYRRLAKDMCNYISTHIHTYIHAYIHTHVHIHIYIHTYIRALELPIDPSRNPKDWKDLPSRASWALDVVCLPGGNGPPCRNHHLSRVWPGFRVYRNPEYLIFLRTCKDLYPKP